MEFELAYFKTKSSRRRPSSKSNAELVLLRVTDKLCVSYDIALNTDGGQQIQCNDDVPESSIKF